MAVRLQTVATTSAPTMASATPALMPEMSLTFSVDKTAPFLVTFSCTLTNTAKGTNQGDVFLVLDGTADIETNRQFSTVTALYDCIAITKILWLTPRTHTIQVYWDCPTQAVICDNISRSLSILEVSL